MLQLLEFGMRGMCWETWRTGADCEYSSFTDCGRDRRGEQILDWGNRSVSDISLCETGQLIQFCVGWVMCLSEYSSMLVHACFQLSLSCLTSHEHKRSTLTQVSSQVSNHFARLSSSWCRCVETPLSSIVSQSKENLHNIETRRWSSEFKSWMCWCPKKRDRMNLHMLGEGERVMWE